MIAIGSINLAQFRLSIRPWLTMVALGCAATAANRMATAEGMPAHQNPAIPRSLQVVGTETSTSDGQTSWILEPDVRRTPKIPGLESHLPPHIEQRMNYAFDLAQRGATYSAIGEFQAVLGLCALELDERDHGTSHRDALRQGLIALDEADQFSGEQVGWRESADVRRIAVGHLTPVLHQPGQPAIDSIRAVQAYYAFAEQRLAFACQGIPGASLAYYGLGRTISVPGMRVAHSAGKAALYHRVALSISPQNVLSANELGVLLAQHGELDGAVQLLQYCVAVEPSPETYRNLSIVYARKGDQHSSQIALASAEALSAKDAGPPGAGSNTAVLASSSNSTDPPDEAAKKTYPLEKMQLYLSKFQVSSLVPKMFRR